METRAARARRLDTAICPVCLLEGPRTRLLSCPHLFHLECLLQWCEQENSCPVCREFSNHIIGPQEVLFITDRVQHSDD